MRMLERCGVRVRQVKTVRHLKGLDGLVIPGGESTTIGKLMVKYGFVEPLVAMARAGTPVYGTCAGLILLAKRVTEGSQPVLDLMDIEARRNAFGRQTESFEADVMIAGMDGPFRAVFIRAPWIEKVSDGVTVMAEANGKAVMARQDNLLVTAFHPELTDDVRVHEYFISMIDNKVRRGDTSVRSFQMGVHQAQERRPRRQTGQAV